MSRFIFVNIKLSLILASFLFLATAQAEELKAFDCSGKKPLSGEELRALTAVVQRKYSKLKSFKAGFLQASYLAALEVSELSSGEVVYSKPGRMKWSYKEPEKQEFISDGHSLWFYQPKERQVLVDDFRNAFVSEIPVSFLLGVGNLESDFKPVAGCRGSEGKVIELMPMDSNRSGDEKLRTVKLIIDLASHLPVGARVVDIGGNVTAFLLKDMKTGEEIGEDFFEPSFPDGVDVIDRRKDVVKSFGGVEERTEQLK